MLDENRLSDGYKPTGMDNRIYCQQKLIAKMDEKINRRHLEVFSETFRQEFICTVP